MDAVEGDVGVNHQDSMTEKPIAGSNKEGVRLVLEFATAYAVTKAFLPVRVAASVWATPWFARTTLVPMGTWLRRLLGRR